MDFNELKTLFQSKFDFKINLEKPYKIADYRPAFGYVFDKYLDSKYDYWGFCDLDIIFGNICDYLKSIDFESGKFDKIGNLGHFQLLKNNETIKMVFKEKNKLDFFENYKRVFKHKYNYWFDEQFGFGLIAINNSIKCYYPKDWIADITPSIFNFTIRGINPRSKNYFVWREGRLFRYIENRQGKKEYAYLHLQKRKMKYVPKNSIHDVIIIPNEILVNKKTGNVYNLIKLEKKFQSLPKESLSIGLIIHKIIFKVIVKIYRKKYERYEKNEN